LLKYGAHAEQLADVWHGGGDAVQRPLVMLLHGGFWRPQYDRSESVSMAAALADRGWTVASAEYRRIPGDPDATLEDAAAALASLPGQIVAHDGRVIVIGNSAGGHLALWLAAQGRGLHGVIALAPIADLALAHADDLGRGAVRDFLGTEPGQRTDADPRLLVSPAVPVIIIQGGADAVVPAAASESYVSAHPATRYVKLADAGHFALIDPLSAAWPTVVLTLDRLGAKAGIAQHD
jgi:acetyl esterase/lipase